jgi:dihydrodipicolinate reductase
MIVNFQAFIDIGSVADIETVIGAAKDVDKKRICGTTGFDSEAQTRRELAEV